MNSPPSPTPRALSIFRVTAPAEQRVMKRPRVISESRDFGTLCLNHAQTFSSSTFSDDYNFLTNVFLELTWESYIGRIVSCCMISLVSGHLAWLDRIKPELTIEHVPHKLFRNIDVYISSTIFLYGREKTVPRKVNFRVAKSSRLPLWNLSTGKPCQNTTLK